MDDVRDSLPEIAQIEPGSAAERAGLRVGDRVVSVDGVAPRDILEWTRLVDEPECDIVVLRGREEKEITVSRRPDEPFGASIDSALFDRIHTCDNHCEFCFIYQLPKGMRRSLYLKDDDYRLSFLFGNFTTLTRFTEADLERVIDERLSPLYVSVHAMDPHVRAAMLRNDRGGMSLRWMRLLMDNGIDVRLQVVLCPGVNDGSVLDHTLASILESCPTVDSVAIVPLGLSRHNTEARMRVQTVDEAGSVVRAVEKWQGRFLSLTGRQPLHLSDEFYMVAGIEVPGVDAYGGYPMLEDGVGLVRSFIESFEGRSEVSSAKADGFFSSVDSRSPTDYVRAPNPAGDTGLRSVRVALTPRRTVSDKPPAVVTGTYGATMMRDLLGRNGFGSVPVVEVVNGHFGGNTAVAGLLTYSDVRGAIVSRGRENVYLLPDVCLNRGVFLDGATIEELSSEFDVEVVATDGAALRRRLEASPGGRDRQRTA